MENLFTVKQVGFIIKIHPLTVRRYIREKKLPAIKVAGSVRIKEEDLNNFQKAYKARSSIEGIAKEPIKIFSFADPLWKLDGVSASLTLPGEEL